ncbi:MAG: hypothetical protein ACI9LZ_002756, partial [Glaciecola sp.]
MDDNFNHRPAETTARPETNAKGKSSYMAMNSMEDFEALLEESFEMDTPEEGS